MKLVMCLLVFLLLGKGWALAEDKPYLRSELIYEIHEGYPWTHAPTREYM